MRRSALGARPILPHPLRLLPLAALLLLLAPHSRGAPQRFLWLSDVHLDHLYNQPGGYGACTTPSTARPMGAFGCDAPDALLDAALAAMRAAEPQPAFLLLTGDSSRHAPPSQAVMADLLRNVSQRLESVFTRVRRMHSPAIEPHLRAVLPVIGNNDVYPDYELPLQPNSTLLEDVAEAWAHELSAEEMAQVKYGGYFMRNMTDVLSVVALNTVVYSIYHTPAETPLPDDPLGQFAWLNDTLWQLGAAGRKVLVVGHIPPCVDSFGARPHLWHQDYLTALNGLLALHRETITALLFGHLHADEFRIPVLDGQVGLPLLLAGSLTPLYKNNPSFRVVTVDDDTGELLDYEVYYMDIANEVYEFMPLYRFSEAYGGARPQARDYLELACSFDGATPETSDVFARFLAYTSSNVTGSLHMGDGHNWTCLATTANQDEFRACVASDKPPAICAAATSTTTAAATTTTKATTTTEITESTTDSTTTKSTTTSSTDSPTSPTAETTPTATTTGSTTSTTTGSTQSTTTTSTTRITTTSATTTASTSSSMTESTTETVTSTTTESTTTTTTSSSSESTTPTESQTTETTTGETTTTTTTVSSPATTTSAEPTTTTATTTTTTTTTTTAPTTTTTATTTSSTTTDPIDIVLRNADGPSNVALGLGLGIAGVVLVIGIVVTRYYLRRRQLMALYAPIGVNHWASPEDEML